MVTRSAEDLAEDLGQWRASYFKLEEKKGMLEAKLKAVQAEIDAAESNGMRFVSTSALKWAMS